MASQLRYMWLHMHVVDMSHGLSHVPCVGVFVFSSGCLVVVEDLTNGRQRHMEGTYMYMCMYMEQHVIPML